MIIRFIFSSTELYPRNRSSSLDLSVLQYHTPALILPDLPDYRPDRLG